LHALLEVSCFLQGNKFLDSGKSRYHLQGAGLPHLSQEGFLISKESPSVLRTVTEDTVELITAPLNAVLNQVGEVPHSAHGDGIFWRVLYFMIAQSLVRDYHLRVSLGSQSTRFKEGDFVPDTSFVHVITSVNIINGINHEIDAFPEFVIEKVFCLLSYLGGVGFEVEIRVHSLGNFGGALRLLFTNVVVSEKELAVEVAGLN